MKNKLKTICILLGIAVICILLCLFIAKLYQSEENTVDAFIQQDHVVEEYLVIEGLETEYELLFLTDTHMIIRSEDDDEQVKANAESRAPMFYDAAGVSSAEQFPEWMEYANEREVDAVLLGGDIIDYPSNANVSYMHENLSKLEMPYLYTLGNHDWTYPWEYMTDTAKTEYIPMLEPAIKENGTIQILDMEDFIVVSVDNSSGQIHPDALERYLEVLEMGRPVIVMVHVPFMTQSVLARAREVWSSPVVIGGGNYGGIYPSEESTAFIEATTAEDSPVVAVLAGHVHFYDKDYIDGEKPVIQIVGNAGFVRSGIVLHITGDEIKEEDSE